MLDQLDRQIDAVVVSTPDHTHAVASVKAMQMGKHCYCEKPLAHSVYEARVMAELAAAKKLATQLGIQRHCWDNFARVVELIQSGTIGPVRECHVWIGGNRGGGRRPTETPPVPPQLNWDLWLGPAPERPYHSGVRPVRLAVLVGLRHRRDGQSGLPPSRFAVPGVEPGASADHRGRGTARGCRDHAAVDQRPLRVCRPGQLAAAGA